MAITLVLSGALFYFLYINFQPKAILSFVPLIVITGLVYQLLVYLIVIPASRSFKKTFAERAIQQMLIGINSPFRINPKKSVSKQEFERSKLFLRFNKFESEELFEGTMDGIPVRFSEVLAQQNRATLFNGFYVCFYYNTDEILELDVIKDSGFNLQFLEEFNFQREELVPIPDKDFEMIYRVFSNSPKRARSIVDFPMRESLLALSEQLQEPLYLTIRENMIHAAFEDTTDYFHLNLDKTCEKMLDTIYKDIQKIEHRIVLIKQFLDNHVVPKIGYP